MSTKGQNLVKTIVMRLVRYVIKVYERQNFELDIGYQKITIPRKILKGVYLLSRQSKMFHKFE